MPDFVCHACNQKKPQNQVRECDKCRRILCESCWQGRSVCKDSPKGTAGCNGTYRPR